MNDQLRALGAAVRRRRRYLELTQDEVADKAGCEAQFIADLERGSCNPEFDVLVKIAQAMQTSTSALVTDMINDSDMEPV
jgi:transcriptional regulator with XRE-family HTH domain